MLRITKITDYGFVILAHMARDDMSALHNAKELSASIDVPLPTVSKVLKILTKNGVLKSHQGSKGGYFLAIPPEKITASSIVEIFEGTIALTDCSSEEGCVRNCQNSPTWQKVNNKIIHVLQELTLAEMVHK
jgi:FeS assembly SUF system regulator